MKLDHENFAGHQCACTNEHGIGPEHEALFQPPNHQLFDVLLAACGGGGGSAGTPGGSASPSNFKVNAPTETTLAVGQKVSYSISGGLSPYLVTNNAPTVVTAVIAGGNLEVTPLKAGSATVTVSPTGGGASFSISVLVATSANPLQVLAPDTVTLSTGNSGSFAILGGAPTYRVVSSAPGVIKRISVSEW